MTAPRETAPAGTEGVEIPEDVALAVSDYGRACEYMGELAHRPGTERATREAGEARQEADREIVKALTFWKARAEAAEREAEQALLLVDVLKEHREAEVAAATPAQQLAGWVLDQWQDEPGDLDAGDVEAQLIASGLLAVERRVVPCGDGCSCRDAADEGEATDCNRHTAASRAALRAFMRPALPAPAPTMAGEP